MLMLNVRIRKHVQIDKTHFVMSHLGNLGSAANKWKQISQLKVTFNNFIFFHQSNKNGAHTENTCRNAASCKECNRVTSLFQKQQRFPRDTTNRWTHLDV